MDYFELIEKSIMYIEENLDKEILIDDLSKIVYTSKFHFQRLFKAIVGLPVITYIRKRKLSKSLNLIKNSKMNLLEIALEFGFNSQEAFTRAFKNQFKITPGNFRKSDIELDEFKIPDLLKIKMFSLNVGFLIDYKILELKEKILVGLETEMYIDYEFKVLEKFWMKIIQKIDNSDLKVNKKINYSIISDGYIDNSYKYFGGYEIDKFVDISNDFSQKEIRVQKYAMFIHKAKTFDGETYNLDKTIDLIYRVWIPKSNYKLSNDDIGMIITNEEENLININEETLIYIYIPIEDE